MMKDDFERIWESLAGLATSCDAAPMSKHEGCWEKRLNEQWEISVNGHGEEKECVHGAVVPPFTIYVRYNGWPAGLIDSHGGSIAAGEGANIDTFLDALKGKQNDK